MESPNKILVIDDDLEDQQFLLETINRLYPSSTIIASNNGREALDYIEKNPPPPSVIFLDLNMPLINGFEFLAAYKQQPRYKDTYVIIYSTSSNPRDKKFAKDLGAADFITKIADTNLLQNIIQKSIQEII